MDQIRLTVNGEPYTVSGAEVSAGTSLQQWLAARLQLFGTKAMCRQGGCGACVVSVRRHDPALGASGQTQRMAVNSCLVHVLSCHEWDVTTVEGAAAGGVPHVVQRRLVEHNATQCGYCTPGWVMAIYSLYESGAQLTKDQLEREFGGHLCRCTGYRPLLDAVRTFATDADPIQDVEDLHKLQCLYIGEHKSGRPRSESDPELGGEWVVVRRAPPLRLALAPAPSPSHWYKAYTIEDVFQILAKTGIDSYRFVAGNTGRGVYPVSPEPRVLVDISAVAALHETVSDANLCVGAGVALAAARAQLAAWAQASQYRCLAALADHLDLVAHPAVRNVGTLGGNLALKHQHPEFPSDVFLLLDTVGAYVTIVDSKIQKKDLSMQDFLKEDLTNKLIMTVKLPPLASSYQIRTYKVMPRAQNALAIVNAGFLFKLDPDYKVLSARICFGAMGAGVSRAGATERALSGRQLDDECLRAALRALSDELRPAPAPSEPAPECRRNVALGLPSMDSKIQKKDLSMQDFLKEDLTNKLIMTVKLPPLASSYQIRTYKVMPRAQNALAIVNAGFLFKLDPDYKVLSARICFGAMGAGVSRAGATERALSGRQLDDECLRAALRALSDELRPAPAPSEPAPECRRNVALGLLYRAMLSLLPADRTSPRFASGGRPLSRGASRAQQAIHTDRALWPLTQPVPKLEALAQVTGAARYSCEVTAGPRDAHAAFVLADVACADILHIDATDALKVPGVVACLTAKDIPGRNSFTPLAVPWQQQDEEILCERRTRYHGQPLAVIVAATQELALQAASLVKVQYGGARTPVLDVPAALAALDRDRRVREEVTVPATDRGVDVQHVLRGRFSTGAQFHLALEPHGCRAAPAADTLRLRCGAQWPDLVHVAVAQALNMQENRVEVEVERVGGAYGGKATRAALVACACALAAARTRRPVVLQLPVQHAMRALGARQPCLFDYEVGVDAAGLIQYLEMSYYSDCGWSFNDTSGADVAATVTSLYDARRFRIKGHSVLTDKASNTWCRAPATTEGTAIMEHIMEQIAFTVKRDPIEVKLQHFKPEHAIARELVATLRNDCDYDARVAAAAAHNRANAWTKRGLSLSVMAYPIAFSGNYAVTLSVYHGDGSVAAAHAGVEMGQGINTKLAQVIAHTLGIPLSLVAVRGTDSFVSPNAMASNGSITSESVALAALKACGQLLARLPPAPPPPGASPEDAWRARVKQAYENGVNLQASYMMSAQADPLPSYSVYGACAVEAELHVLTGERIIRRADILEDAGRSMSPLLDIGQIEGAFVMGLGLWLSEALVYDADGRLLTADTWGYVPPGARDVPEDLRVALRHDSRADSPTGVLRSKATGEPALVLAVAAALALRGAAHAAATEFGHPDAWLDIDIPYNIENILKAVSPNINSFKLK